MDTNNKDITIHSEPESLSAKCFEKLLHFYKPLPNINNQREYEKERERNRVKYKLPWYAKKLGFYQSNIDPDTYIVDKFYDGSSATIFYVHGGAYWLQPSVLHYHFLYKLSKKNHCRIVLPVYPKAPNNNYMDCEAMIMKVYQEMLKIYQVNPSQLVFMGDSAGGGFLASFIQKVQMNNMVMPKQLILISPWMDASMENPQIKLVQKKDPMLLTSDLKIRGNIFAEKNTYSLSAMKPIDGNYKEMPKIDIITGTNDILFPDILEFQKRASLNNWKVHTYIFKDMIHVFPLFPTKESNLSHELITRTLKQIL